MRAVENECRILFVCTQTKKQFLKREFNFIAELWQYVQEIEILFVHQIYPQNNRGKLEIWDAPVCLSFTPELTSWPRCKQSSSVNGSESILILLDLAC